MSADPPSSVGHGHNLLLVLILITGVQAMATLAVLSLATLAPAVSASFGIGAHFVGYQVSIIYISAAAISLIAGTLVRRWGAVATSQYALILCIVGVLGLSAGNLLVVVIGSLLIGTGYGLTNPAASHLLSRYAPPAHRNLLFSIKQTAVPLGGVLAGLMLPALTALAGWRIALLAGAGLSAALFLVLQIYRRHFDIDREPGRPLRKNMQSGMRMLAQRSDLIRLSVMAFCFSATQLSLMSFAVSMLVEDLAKTLVIAGTVVSLMQGFGAFGRIFWGVIADRFPSGVPILISIGILSILSSLAMMFVNPAWPFAAVIVLLCVFGACAIGWNGVFLAEVARVSRPEEVGSMTGMVLFFTFSGVVVGPTFFATTYNVLGSYPATYGVMALFPTIGTVALLGLRRTSPAVEPHQKS
ncbi:MAG: MFS transporter [Desulfofustis sp.]|nr:MFS transporter [Desulfofustis sp.]